MNLTNITVHTGPETITYADVLQEACIGLNGKLALAISFLLIGLILYQVIVPELIEIIKGADMYKKMTVQGRDDLESGLDNIGRTLITVGVAFVFGLALFEGLINLPLKIVVGGFMLVAIIIKLKGAKNVIRERFRTKP